MKRKVLIIAIVLLSTVLLSACGNNPPSLEDRITESHDEENTSYTYNGVVEKLELDVYQQGTHQLRTDDELIIIQSQAYDLNKYLEKRVVIEGVEADLVGNSEWVLSVTSIELEDGEITDEQEEYESRLYGFRFNYPSIWELAIAEGDIILAHNEDIWVTIETYSDKADLDSFAETKEGEEGTAVTIASQRSLRYLEGDSITMYIPNPPKKKIYKISFNKGELNADTEKDYFYNILESFELIYLTVKSGEKCGGRDKLECIEGYVCELSSGEKNASGTCVSIDSSGEDQECPYIAPPSSCSDYVVDEYSKTGCPSRYKCVESDEDEEREGSVDLDTDSLLLTIEKYQDQILSLKNAEIIQYELSELESLIAVVYKSNDKKYKKLYSYAPSANEFNFIEKAYFEEGDGKDWEKISGENLQTNLQVSVIKRESESVPREVSGDMRLYENSHKDFSLEYPKNWYYRSFGAINNTRWIVGFSEDEVEVLSDAIITVSILDEAPESSSMGYYKVIDRDGDSVYVIEGPDDLKEIINLMADSIE